MRKAIDFQSWEVGLAKGQATGMMATVLGLFTLLGTLVVLAVSSVVGADVFHQGFWFFLLIIVIPIAAAWFKIQAELVRLRYHWETRQENEDD